MNITEIPFDLPGKLYRGTMPYEITTKPKILTDLKMHHIRQIVLLCPQDECEFTTFTDLKALYEKNGFKVLYFPIIDHQVPDIKDLRVLVDQLYQDLKSNQKHTLVHCLEGKGRTGLVIACLARKILKFNHHEAIAWVRKLIPGAIENVSQIQMIKDFIPESIPDPGNALTKSGIASIVKGESKPIKLTELPLDLKSKLYKGTIPFGILQKPEILAEMKNQQIKHIVVLCSAREYQFATGTDLLAVYKEHGFNVIHFPIKDSEVPNIHELKHLVQELIQKLSETQNNLFIHCMNGKGRTGLVTACIARAVLKLKGNEAIEWVRLFTPNALDSKCQRDMVEAFA